MYPYYPTFMQVAGRWPFAITTCVKRSASLCRTPVHATAAVPKAATSVAIEAGKEEALPKVDLSCKDCKGEGRVLQGSGGYHRKNPLNTTKLLGTKWTAREPVLGWRHFVVTERRKTDDFMYAYLIATCDTEVGIWINVTNLRDRAIWACGWLQKVQLQDLDTPEYRTCKACGGSGLSKGYFKA